MNPKKKELLDKLEQKNTRVNAIYDALADADPSTEQKSELERLENEMGEVEGELKPILEAEQKRADAKERTERINKHRLPVGANKGADAGRVTEDVDRALGAKFARSPEYKAWLKSVAPNGRIADRTPINAPTVAFDGLSKALRSKAAGSTIVTSGEQGDALLDYTRTATVIEGFMRMLTVRDLLTVVPITQGTDIKYARMNRFDNNAATVPEANVSKYTGAAGQIEGRKPESGLGMEVITDRVKTVAHWITETNQVIMDVPQLESLVESFLLYGLKEKSEGLTVTGDGLGENFQGVLHTPFIQEQPYDGDILRTLRRARTKIKTPGRVTPTAYLLNPLDWEKIDLDKDGQGRYYFGGPTEMGNPRVWGLPVVESEAVPEGTGIVAAWQFGVLYDRMQGTITATNAHEDYFVRNLVAVLAECREGFGVRYTKAFCAIDLTPGA